MFNASGQRLETEGQPTDATRAVLRVSDSNLTSAINGVNWSGIVIRNLSIDGARPKLGPHQGDALIEIGGNASDQIVQDVDARDTRSWSTLHLAEGQVSKNVPTCQGDQVTHNRFGPAGTPDNWADGISLACGHTTVADNTVTDATDGAIVIFGAPGSMVHGNTIVAASRTLLGAINMVDLAPVAGNYAGTVVSNNVIDAQGALIKVAVAMGPRVWTCVAGTATGGTVTANTLQGAHMGYGFAVNGVANWTVTSNVDNSTHVGTTGPACGGPVSPPTGFQYQDASSSVLQPQFVAGKLTYLLGLHT
jgi:hypothetical protein